MEPRSVRPNALARVIAALAMCAVIAVLVVAPALAGSPNHGHAKARDGVHPSCHGLANAYAHGGAVAEVAAKHGCDLTGITPTDHPANGDADAEDVDEPDNDANEGNGPPGEVVAAKCNRIADKLAAAGAREHGNSAAAFSRQSDKWSCPD